MSLENVIPVIPTILHADSFQHPVGDICVLQSCSATPHVYTACTQQFNWLERFEALHQLLSCTQHNLLHNKNMRKCFTSGRKYSGGTE